MDNSFYFLGVLLIIIVGFGLLKWHSQNSEYNCPKCGKKFKLSALEDFLSLNGLTKKYVKCPRCKYKSWMKVLKTKKS